MPKKAGYILSRLSNFTKGAKHLLEHFSPRKKNKRQRTEEPETELHDDDSAEMPRPPSPAVFPDEDVFSAGETTHTGFFYCNSRPHAPTAAPQTYSLEFSLHSINFPSPEEDTDSLLGTIPNRDDQSFIHTVDSCHSDESDNLDDDCSIHGDTNGESRDGKNREAPTLVAAEGALKDIREFLRGKSRGKGGGFIPPNLDPFMQSRMEGMKTLLALYTNPQSTTYGKWSPSSFQAAITLNHGRYCARQLRKLSRAYIADCTVLPVNPYGDWNESMLVDEDLCNDINLYLQELGNQINSEKVVEFLSRPEVKEKHGITKKITARTARRYLKALGFRFTHAKKGQYSDGHEREDVVYYRDKVFIVKWEKFQVRMRNWKSDNVLECEPSTPGKRVVVWFHDETIFYAHDRRRRTWYHKDTPALPYAKGEGASLMVAHYVSADYGLLVSQDGKRTARRILKPGKNRDGYFTNEDILEQFREAVALAKEEYPDDEHIFIYDNATTHLKRPENAPSARHMPKFTPKPGNNWLVEVIKRDASGNPIRKADSSFEKVKVQMADATFNEKPQPLYFPEGHLRAGVFKGMMVILEERGFKNVAQKKAQCKDFKCPPGVTDCCCRRLLYSQPDFAAGESNLEILAKKLGVQVIFLPKFHCELNPIEQCWGYAKRVYRLNPESSREDQLEKNALASLAVIPLESIRRFANRARRFIDAYSRGLNGRQAAWAARKYRGHRVLPESLLRDLDEAKVV